MEHGKKKVLVVTLVGAIFFLGTLTVRYGRDTLSLSVKLRIPSNRDLVSLDKFVLDQRKVQQQVSIAYRSLGRRPPQHSSWNKCGRRITNTYWFRELAVVYTGEKLFDITSA